MSAVLLRLKYLAGDIGTPFPLKARWKLLWNFLCVPKCTPASPLPSSFRG